MPLTKGSAELVQDRAARDPNFAAALPHERLDASPPLTMREALREIWLAASYPILGNGDALTGATMDAAALERAGTPVPGPDSLPQFATWIAALCDPRLPESERDDIILAIYDLFDPERD